MSASTTSKAGVIDVLDPPQQVTRKIRRAVTDADVEVRYDPQGKPGVANLLEVLAAITGGHVEKLADEFDSYGQLKAECAEAIVALLQPIQERYEQLRAAGDMPAILKDGARRASAVAAVTLERAQANAGLLRP